MVFFATTLDGILTIALSIIGSLAYGNYTREIVLMNLSYGRLSNVVQLIYSFSVLCSFMLQIFPITDVVNSNKHLIMALIDKFPTKKHYSTK